MPADASADAIVADGAWSADASYDDTFGAADDSGDAYQAQLRSADGGPAGMLWGTFCVERLSP